MADTGGWECSECCQENDATDDVCVACEQPRPADARYNGYRVGLVMSSEGVPGKDKLHKLSVDVGLEKPLQIVTNCGNAGVGKRVVVATVGATVRSIQWRP